MQKANFPAHGKYCPNFDIYTTWMCIMSYEREFCGLSEYVQFQIVRQIIKSILQFKRDRVDFGLRALEIKSNFKAILGHLKPY